MRIFVAAVSGEQQYQQTMISVSELIKEPTDEAFIEYGLRGSMARTIHAENFLKLRNFDAIFFMDTDMIFPPDTLQRLRSHDLDIVGGHYYMRQMWPKPVFSIVRHIGNGTWPFPWSRDIPKEGLHEIAVMGHGCTLIKREAMEAVARTLPPNLSPVAERPMPKHTGGSHHVWGSDYAFFTAVRELGYKVWLDASIRCGHMCSVVLDDALYDILEPHNNYTEAFRAHYGQSKEVFGVTAPKTVNLRISQIEEEIRQIVKQDGTLQKELKQIQENRDQLKREWQAGLAVIQELKRWTGEAPEQQGPQITKIGNLPIATPDEIKKMRREDAKEKKSKQDVEEEGKTPEEIRQLRESVYTREAQEHIEALDARDRIHWTPTPSD